MTSDELRAKLRTLWERLNSDPSAARAKRVAPECLVLQWEPEHVIAIEAQVRSSVSIDRAVEFQWPATARPEDSASAAAEFLKEQLAAAKIGARQAVVVIPREQVVVRRLDLPDVPDEELPDLVRFQAATKAATSLDRMSLDFVPLPPQEDAGRSALVATLDMARLRRIQEIVLGAGLELQGVALTPMATAELVLQKLDEPERQRPAIVIWQTDDYVELSLLSEGRLTFMHSIRLFPGEGDAHIQPLRTELNRALVAMSHSAADVSLDRANYLPGRHGDPAVQSLLKDRFASGVQVIDAAESVDAARLKPEERELVSRAGPSIGQLLARRTPTLPAIDFANPRRRVAPPDRRKERLKLGLGAAAILALLGLWMFQSAKAKRTGLLEEIAENNATLRKANNDAKPELDAADKLNKWLAGDVRPLDGAAKLFSLLPGTDRLYITELKARAPSADADAKLTAMCYARTDADINALQESLVANGYRVAARPIAASTKDPDYPREYPLEVEHLKLPPKPAAPPSGAVPAVAAAGN
ncbi:MAG: hypothetical protein KF774_13865 [Planctomyces sp.]|nr:hypothetical protein [Planctomyces sp.]